MTVVCERCGASVEKLHSSRPHRFCSRSCAAHSNKGLRELHGKTFLGKRHNPKTLEKLRLAKTGKIDNTSNRWLGDSVGYSGLHKWVGKKLGKPQVCWECGITGERHHWANLSGEYKRNTTDWARLCPLCHKKYDKSKLPDLYLSYRQKSLYT